jgi:hypothetical protein
LYGFVSWGSPVLEEGELERSWMVVMQARCLAIATMFLLVSACHKEDVTVPDRLVGLWTTTASRYEDRNLEFTSKQIIFRVGQEYVSANPIQEIQSVSSGGQIAYTVTYKSLHGDKRRLSFTYDPSSLNGEIRISHQGPVTWTRDKR